MSWHIKHYSDLTVRDINDMVAKVRRDHPTSYIRIIDIGFPRVVRQVLYADPDLINKDMFEKACDKIYKEIWEEAMSY